ncbi:MAG: lamin tail domain-containing protein, partial [Ignavibacterium sp.]|nr:lamin tail domain-containing protein [Ignavibacterium sp.]
MKYKLHLFIILSSFFLWSSLYAQTPLINELFSRGTAVEPDWIEIYNPSSSSIDITGYKIYDNGGKNGTKPKKEFPSGSVIPAQGFLVIITDDADPSGFGLSSGGEWVWFENTTGTVIDSVNMAAVTDPEASYGRLPDGSANWQILIPRTRGTSNTIIVVTPVINELFSRGTEIEPDWIEIYNPSSL